MLSTYQENSWDAGGQSLCLHVPDQGLWGVEQEHNRLVVNVHCGNGVQMQRNLGGNRKPGESLALPSQHPQHPDPSQLTARSARRRHKSMHMTPYKVELRAAGAQPLFDYLGAVSYSQSH